MSNQETPAGCPCCKRTLAEAKIVARLLADAYLNARDDLRADNLAHALRRLVPVMRAIDNSIENLEAEINGEPRI